MLEIELFWHLDCVLMLNWIIWNKTVFTFNCEMPSRLRLQNTPTAPLYRGRTPPHQRVSWYDAKQSDDEVPVMLELWGMLNTLSLPLFPGQLWPRVVAPDRALSKSQIELNYVLMLNWIAWNRSVLACKLHTYAKLNCLK